MNAMAYHPATLSSLHESKFTPCGHAGCKELATHVLVAGAMVGSRAPRSNSVCAMSANPS